MSNVSEGFSVENQGTGSYPAPHWFRGGSYVLKAIAGSWSSGSVKAQARAPDGSTWIDVGSTLSADGQTAAFDLPPGEYQIVIAGASAVYAALVGVPR